VRHIFDSNISSQAYDWEDDPFGTDYLMQANNRHATITADDEYEDYINPDTRRRNKTQAPQLFKILDNHKALFGQPMDNAGELAQLAMDHGTSPYLATKYNVGNQTDKDLIAQGVEAASNWSATATPVQLAVQRKAAEKANAYKLAGKAPALGVDYTDFGGLSQYEADKFFNGTPEVKQAIASKINTEMRPWEAPYETPAADEFVPSTKVEQFAASESARDSAPGEPTPHGRHRDLPPVDTAPYAPPPFDDLDYIYRILEELFPSKGLIERIAIAETKEGRDSSTARQGYHGGVFQVDRGTFRETQIQPGLKRQRDIVSKFINRGWNSVSWEELRTSPILSGFAARLSLLRWKKAIPADIPGQAEYWKEKYNTVRGAGTPQEFIQRQKDYHR
jgi:hypothetical protein